MTPEKIIFKENGKTCVVTKTHETVYITTDYEIFKKLRGNRDVTPQRVEKIKKSIQEVGYVKSYVTCNEKFEVIDGQGRVQALKELGLPVHFVIAEKAGLKECLSMNIHQEKWKLTDYIQSYADTGNQDYISLECFLSKYGKYVPIKIIVSVCAKGIVGEVGKTIKEGNFKFFQRRETAAQIFEYLMRFEPYMQYISHKTTFFLVMVFVWETKELDSGRMLEVIEKHPQKITPFSSVEECLDSMEKIYNYRRSKGQAYFKPLYHQYATRNMKDWQKKGYEINPTYKKNKR